MSKGTCNPPSASSALTSFVLSGFEVTNLTSTRGGASSFFFLAALGLAVAAAFFAVPALVVLLLVGVRDTPRPLLARVLWRTTPGGGDISGSCKNPQDEAMVPHHSTKSSSAVAVLVVLAGAVVVVMVQTKIKGEGGPRYFASSFFAPRRSLRSLRWPAYALPRNAVAVVCGSGGRVRASVRCSRGKGGWVAWERKGARISRIAEMAHLHFF